MGVVTSVPPLRARPLLLALALVLVVALASPAAADRSAPVSTSEAVVAFGEDDAEPTTSSAGSSSPTGDEGAAGGNPVLPLIGVALVVAALAATVLYPRRKLRPRPPTS
jgi:hypothetical protein